jgi:hypothetical protein
MSENTVVTSTPNEKEKVEQLKQAPTTTTTESFANKLQNVVKERIDQIAECNEQASKWQERSCKLQEELNADLAKVQNQFGIKITAPQQEKKKSATPTATINKNSTAPQLIRAFLEKHGTAKTSEIREFLISKGKKTNPGVALSRMVKEGVILNTERGMYKLA